MKTGKFRLFAGLILATWTISSATGIAIWQSPTLWTESVQVVVRLCQG